MELLGCGDGREVTSEKLNLFLMMDVGHKSLHLILYSIRYLKLISQSDCTTLSHAPAAMG